MIRLDKYLSQKGLFSRREAKYAILTGNILVNGKIVQEPGTEIDKQIDEINISTINAVQNTRETVLVYKPRGYISSKDIDNDGKNIFSAFPKWRHLNVVGRLDKESEGLIILSNDGIITNVVTGPHHGIEKEYIVTTREDVTPAMCRRMSSGINIGRYTTLPAEVEKISKKSFRITLREGKKHQIRRMASAVHLTVNSLKRVRIHTLKIGSMQPGHFRKLTQIEIDDLKSTLE